MSVPADFPTTPAELYDLLREQFGIGDYDDAMTGVPWFKFRMREIAKLRAMLKRRRVTERQVAIAVWYARTNDIPITAAWRLFALVPVAMVAFHKEQRETVHREREQTVDDVIQEAIAAGDNEWASRLLRAAPGDVEALIKEWRER